MEMIPEQSHDMLGTYRNTLAASKELYSRALNLFPNGVTHDSRFLRPFPVYITRASGSKKWDEDGREYIDYWCGHGALLLGHGHPKVVEAVTTQMSRGTHYGASHRLEVEWGEQVIDMVPSAERIRFVSSGTEATLMAIRLARTFTGKNKVLKFAGHFHGWHDYLISGVNPPYEVPPPGIPGGVTESTVVCPPNDIRAVEERLQNDPDIACIIIEPTGGFFGGVRTGGNFLKQLREVTLNHGVVLIFDEVITGFRCAPGGAQEYYQVMPDLTALGKIVAGGLPGAAVVGRKELLEIIELKDDPDWMMHTKMPHPGTFNANPLSASAGIATLKIVATPGPIDTAHKTASMLIKGMNEVIGRHQLNWCVHGEFSGFRFLLNHRCDKRESCDFRFCDYDYRKMEGTNDPTLTQNIRCAMLLNGIDVPQRGGMTSSAHTSEDITRTIEGFDAAVSSMKKSRLISTS